MIAISQVSIMSIIKKRCLNGVMFSKDLKNDFLIKVKTVWTSTIDVDSESLILTPDLQVWIRRYAKQGIFIMPTIRNYVKQQMK
jgi:hypothetical protein